MVTLWLDVISSVCVGSNNRNGPGCSAGIDKGIRPWGRPVNSGCRYLTKVLGISLLTFLGHSLCLRYFTLTYRRDLHLSLPVSLYFCVDQIMSQTNLSLALALPEYSSSPPADYNVAPVATERVITSTLSSRLWSKCNPQPDENECALLEKTRR